MRPNKTGWILVAFFCLGGIAFWATIPEIWIGQIWVGTSVFLALLYVGMNRKADAAEDMMTTGVRGSARILEMTQTGTYINNQPRVKLKLQIEAPHAAPFEDERTMTIPMIFLGRLAIGATLPVYMKADDPQDYVIDWSGSGGGISVERSGQAAVTLPGGDVAQAVTEVLEDHGIDTSTGTVDLRQASAARDAVLAALAAHGIDAAHAAAAADPFTPIEEGGEPKERLLKLKELRSANLITAQEYETQRKRIIEGV